MFSNKRPVILYVASIDGFYLKGRGISMKLTSDLSQARFYRSEALAKVSVAWSQYVNHKDLIFKPVAVQEVFV